MLDEDVYLQPGNLKDDVLQWIYETLLNDILTI